MSEGDHDWRLYRNFEGVHVLLESISRYCYYPLEGTKYTVDMCEIPNENLRTEGGSAITISTCLA
jgi:hypothetical protein